MHDRLDDEHNSRQQQQHSSPRNLSAATSPIKDTIRGSQEFVKKLMMQQGASSSDKVGKSSVVFNITISVLSRA